MHASHAFWLILGSSTETFSKFSFALVALLNLVLVLLQPDNPAELGGKIYEMMGTALAGKWMSAAPGVQHVPLHQSAGSQSPETFEAEVVQDAGGQKWESCMSVIFHVSRCFNYGKLRDWYWVIKKRNRIRSKCIGNQAFIWCWWAFAHLIARYEIKKISCSLKSFNGLVVHCIFYKDKLNGCW